MAPLTKKELRITIANFYKLHHSKGKFFTYFNFKKPIKDKIITKKTVYNILERLDKRGTVERKSGSGRPPKLTQNELKRLKTLVNNKTGVSQRKLSKKFDCCQATISNSLKKTGIFYRKRKRAPKATPAQKTQEKIGQKYCDIILSINFW